MREQRLGGRRQESGKAVRLKKLPALVIVGVGTIVLIHRLVLLPHKGVASRVNPPLLLPLQ